MSNIDWNDPFKGIMEPDKGAQPKAPTPTPVDPKSREGQVATMLRTIESEAGRGESNAEILRRLNDQRVAQGQAPLRIKLTEPKKFPVDPSLTNALFGGMRFAPSGVK